MNKEQNIYIYNKKGNNTSVTCRVSQKELYNDIPVASVKKTFTLKGVQIIHRSKL
jgi:hypothetical protein